MNDILVPVDPADLIDRIIVLQLRVEAVSDPQQRAAMLCQHDLLSRLAARILPADPLMTRLTAQLGTARSDLFHVVRDLRESDGRKDYGVAFIALSQSMLAALGAVDDAKAAINLHLAATTPIPSGGAMDNTLSLM